MLVLNIGYRIQFVVVGSTVAFNCIGEPTMDLVVLSQGVVLTWIFVYQKIPGFIASLSKE